MFNFMGDEKMNKCYFCKSDDIGETIVDYSFWWGDTLIVFKEVPALVCANCAEKYFRPEVSRSMKQMAVEIKEGKRKTKKLAVPTVKFEEEMLA